jgi:uncharacterized membrane protein YcgQ (UPF0703/DUF1980 family)
MTASPTFIALVTAAAWFFIFFVVHIGGLRTGFENARWLLVTYAASLLGTLVTVIAVTVVTRQPTQAIVLAAMIAALSSACLFALYIPALYAVLTSVSVETMMLLRRGGMIQEADLYDRFAGRRIMEQRLATLLRSGYVAPDGSSYRLTPRGRTIAGIFNPLKALWNLGPGG